MGWIIFGLICLGLAKILELIEKRYSANQKAKKLQKKEIIVNSLVVVQGCEDLNLPKGLYYGIKTDSKLTFAKDSQGERVIASFDMDEIKGFAKLSDIRRKNISIGKAIVGGVICGPVGAILGGLMGKDKDESQTILVVSKGANEHVIVLKKICYVSLKEMIPDKEILSSQTPVLQASATQNTKSVANDIEVIEKLVALKDKGVLTEEEFESQKRKILN